MPREAWKQQEERPSGAREGWIKSKENHSLVKDENEQTERERERTFSYSSLYFTETSFLIARNTMVAETPSKLSSFIMSILISFMIIFMRFKTAFIFKNWALVEFTSSWSLIYQSRSSWLWVMEARHVKKPEFKQVINLYGERLCISYCWVWLAPAIDKMRWADWSWRTCDGDRGPETIECQITKTNNYIGSKTKVISQKHWLR